jgi:hypothetical protein
LYYFGVAVTYPIDYIVLFILASPPIHPPPKKKFPKPKKEKEKHTRRK